VQDNSHKANVVVAAGTLVSTVQAAKQTLVNSPQAPSDAATFRTALKNADVSYHQAIIASAVANAQPAPVGSYAVLRQLGVM
jgi:hypothetical protein